MGLKLTFGKGMNKMKKNNFFKRITAALLAIVILLAAFPALKLGVAAAVTDTRVVDPSTMHDWEMFFGKNSTSTANAGGIWMDKTVLKTDPASVKDAFGDLDGLNIDDPDNNFLVVLSALASNKSIVGYSHIPTDTVLVLDVSGSMGRGNGSQYNDAVTELVAAANAAFNSLLSVNKHNRVGVVLYSSDTTVLLPIGRYTQANNTFFVERGTSFSLNSGIQDENKDDVKVISKAVTGSTYIQEGLYEAMQELLAVEDTVIEGDSFQAGTKRMPIMVLMSDGAPTVATDDFMGATDRQGNEYFPNSNIGTGSAASNLSAFATQLTAAYAKARVEEHYDNAGLFYTLGLGLGDYDRWGNLVLSTEETYAQSVLDPLKSTETIKQYWDSYLDPTTSGVTINGNRTFEQSAYVTDMNYVTDYYSADTASELEDAFEAIVNQIIIQSLYYPTLVEENNNNLDGYIEFIDDIGDYMEVTSIKGIELGGTLYTGALLSRNFTTGGGILGTVENPNDMGDNMVWAVMERLGLGEKYDTHEEAVQAARDLITMAYQHGQLSYTDDENYSNYIGWYADKDGNYIGFWAEDHTASDIPAGAVYYNKSYGMLGAVVDGHRESDMMYISIQVHTEIATGHQQVIWRIPASLVPVVSYNVSLNAESVEDATEISVEIDEAAPIRLVFELGLNKGINIVNIDSRLTDEYKAAHKNADGSYNFYTNAYDQAVFDNDAYFPSEAINTVAFFEPSAENEHFYYNVNTTVYYKDGDNYVEYNGRTAPTGDGYYRSYDVFEITNKATGAARAIKMYEPITVASLDKAVRGDDDVWYIPKGVIHRYTENSRLSKTENNTNTLGYSMFGSVESHVDADLTDGDDSYYYIDVILGNNGRMSVTPATGIAIEKTVDNTVTDTNAEFSFTVDATLVADFEAGDYLTLKVDANGNESYGIVTFSNTVFGDTISEDITIKANETIYIVGLQPGTYTVTENLDGKYKVSAINGAPVGVNVNSTEIEVSENHINEAAFVNTVATPGDLVIKKTVIHPYGDEYQIPENITFEFEVFVEDASGNPRANQSYNTSKDGAIATTDANGKLTVGGNNIVLANGEGIMLYDIQETDVVTVREVNVPKGFTADKDEASATISASEPQTIEFINTYEADDVYPVNITVTGAKELEGRIWLDTDSFEFQLQWYDRHAGEWVKVGNSKYATKASPEFSFTDEIQAEVYDAVGTQHYRIVEVYDVNNAIGGVTYDTNARYFNVVITDVDMDGKLEIGNVAPLNLATVTYDTEDNEWNVDVTVTNIYAPHGSSAITVNVNKQVVTNAGIDVSEEGFEFALFQGDEMVGNSAVTAADGKAQLKLVFTAAEVGETYKYTLKEIAGNADGFIYTDKEYDLEVTIIDNLDGTIKAVVYDATAGNDVPENATGEYDAEFTNTYDPDDATVKFVGLKTLNGRDINNGEFEFELYEAANADFTGRTLIETVKNDGTAISFAEITKAQVGTYYFVIVEKAGNVGGITYDTTEYRITVVVTDADVDGKLETAITMTDANAVSKTDIEFVNTYKAAATKVTFEAEKTLEGKELVADQFAFELYTANENFAIIGNAVETKKNDANGNVIFSELTFDTAGTYYYVIKEVIGTEKGVTYDTTVYNIAVEVTDDGSGQLDSSVTVNGTIDAPITFENTYKAAAVTVTFEALKLLDGRTLEADEFEFELYKADANGKKQGSAIQVKKNGADGKILFDAIEYTAVIDQNYIIVEKMGDKGGVTYDTAEYLIKVEVTDDGSGQLKAKVFVNGSENTDINFNNTYEAASTQVVINGVKTLDGKDLDAGEFSFEIYDADADFEKQGTALQTVKNDADGKISFEEIEFTEEGKYYFVIVEMDEDAERVTYDATVYNVFVEVTDNGLGQLVAEVTITKAGSTDKSEVEFKNIYTPKPADINVDIDVIKTVKNIGVSVIGPEGFKFVLENVSDPSAPKSEVVTDKDGKAVFTLTFTEDDIGNTYNYKVYEVDEDRSCITYDDTVYNISIAVSLGTDNKLVATVINNEQAVNEAVAEFENIYDDPYVPSPPTGDYSNITLWLAVLFVSGGLFAGTVYFAKKGDRK